MYGIATGAHAVGLAIQMINVVGDFNLNLAPVEGLHFEMKALN